MPLNEPYLPPNIQDFCSVFNCVICFLTVEFGYFYIFWKQGLHWISGIQDFSPIKLVISWIFSMPFPEKKAFDFNKIHFLMHHFKKPLLEPK